jgi:radical SAM superfamily enzyme YgiQ (UPF0313 family)
MKMDTSFRERMQMEMDSTSPISRVEPILPENQIMCVPERVIEDRDLIVEADEATIRDSVDTEPVVVAKVPRWLEQMKKRQKGTIEPYTPMPGIRIKRMGGELRLVYGNDE